MLQESYLLGIPVLKISIVIHGWKSRDPPGSGKSLTADVDLPTRSNSVNTLPAVAGQISETQMAVKLFDFKLFLGRQELV